MAKRRAAGFSKRLLGSFAGLGFLACAGKSLEGPGDVSAETFPDRYADLVCGTFDGCCREGGEPFDATACRARLRAQAREAVVRGAAPNHRFDVDAARRCLQEFTSATVGCLDHGLYPGLYGPSCFAGLVVGTLPLGARCTTTGECEGSRNGNVNCFTEVYGTPFTCAVGGVFHPPHAQLGEACALTCDENLCFYASADPAILASPYVACYRGEGMYCTGDEHCAPLDPPGTACAQGNECTLDAICSLSLEQCVVRQPDGATCRDSSECINHGCSGVCFTQTLLDRNPDICSYESTPPPPG